MGQLLDDREPHDRRPGLPQAAQRVLDTDLPVGVVTGAVGGVYLGWLLFSGRGRA